MTGFDEFSRKFTKVVFLQHPALPLETFEGRETVHSMRATSGDEVCNMKQFCFLHFGQKSTMLATTLK